MQRNTRLKQAGESPKDYWFSIASEQEEAEALLRGDVVFGVQEEDTMYFNRITQNKIPVLTVPYLPPQHFLQRKESPDTEQLRVGYLASNNAPNISAIAKLIDSLQGVAKIHLYIGGTVCEKLNRNSLSSAVTLVGVIDSLESFYAEYDLYVNPDTFYSGLKCKTVEALSYGCPIVCTKVAGTGIGLVQPYHQLKDERDCGAYLKRISNLGKDEQRKQIMSMQEAGRQEFLQYEQKYSCDRVLQMLGIDGGDKK
jgi:hypothetical protein